MTLKGQCSVIHSNILYVYSAGSFASIPLQQNATWIPLPSPDEKVTSPSCVRGGMEGSKSEEALYVVGGTGSSSDYSGLQRYSFSAKKWEVLGSAPTDMTNRTSHGVGYLESISTLLVYAGDSPSSSTYLISTSSPYTVNSQPAQGAPATANPMLLKWSSSQVALIGGTETGTAVWVYDATSGWAASGVNLASAIQVSNRCIIRLDSQMKILEEFDLSANPNTVTNYQLVDASGSPETTAVTVGVSSNKRSSSDYPTYNHTFAPTTTRTDYSIAQGDNGMVVVSGGSGDNSLAVFNSTKNSWMNATELFYGHNQQNVLKGTTTSSISTTTPTVTSSTSVSPSTTATSSSTAAASVGTSEHTKVIIGATLGSLCGLALILLALLFFIRRVKQKRQGRDGGAGDNKDRLSFQDQGIEPLTERAYPMAKSPVPLASMSADSLAIMSGRTMGEKSLKPPSTNVGYGLSAKPGKSSPLYTVPSGGAAPSSVYSTDVVEEPISAAATGPDNKAGDRTTDEGWSRYFQNNGAKKPVELPCDRSTISSVYTKSDYRGSAWPMANMAPLNMGFLDQPKPLGHVLSGSPTTEHASTAHSLVIPESQSARISSADSLSIASDDDPHDTHDTNWTGTRQANWLNRPASSNYSTSFYNSSTRDIPSQYTQHTYADKTPRNSKGRQSSVAIPEDDDELPIPGRSHHYNSDMSWLNLHADR